MKWTQQDLDALKKLIRVEVEDVLDEQFTERLKYLPTKDEFYKAMDELMKELSAIRDELSLTPSHAEFSELSDKVLALEAIHPHGKHVPLTV